VLDNTAIVYQPDDGIHGIDLRTNPQGQDASLTNVTIVGNIIEGFGGDSDGIIVGAGGVNCQIENLVIHRNSFSKTSFPVELGSHTGPNSRIDGARITANTFTQNMTGVTVGAGPGSENAARGVLIEGNIFSETRRVPLVIHIDSGKRIAISSIRIVNNTFANNGGLTISVRAGGNESMIEGLLFEGNEFLTKESIAIQLGTAGALNKIQNTVVTNNRFISNTAVTIRCEGTQNTVQNTLIAGNRHLGSDVFISIYSVGPDGIENIVKDTQLINNLISHGMNITGGIVIL
jgi:hypothetical protein